MSVYIVKGLFTWDLRETNSERILASTGCYLNFNVEWVCWIFLIFSKKKLLMFYLVYHVDGKNDISSRREEKNICDGSSQFLYA